MLGGETKPAFTSLSPPPLPLSAPHSLCLLEKPKDSAAWKPNVKKQQQQQGKKKGGPWTGKTTIREEEAAAAEEENPHCSERKRDFLSSRELGVGLTPLGASALWRGGRGKEETFLDSL